MCISGQFFYMKFFYTIFWSALLVVIGSKPFETNAEDDFSSGFQPSSTVDRPSFISSVQSFSNGVGIFNTKCLVQLNYP